MNLFNTLSGLILTALLMLSLSCSSKKHDSSLDKAAGKSLESAGFTDGVRSEIVVYYFHPSARCETCLNIEAYSKNAVESWSESNRRELTWKALNIDDPSNEHFRNEFDLQFSSLVIAEYRDGKIERWKNLEEIWNLANDKSKFSSYVNNELNLFIKQ
ncbi:MAG: hypothetical protein IPG99_20985 [Ignavibacteria bacterium]|nr:hypothetical protein [Ignavibacteria bacterium]